MRKEFTDILKNYGITQRKLAENMGIVPELVRKYLSGEKNITPNAAKKIYNALLEIAKQQEISAIKLQMQLNKLQKLLVNMSNGNSIRDV